MVFDALLGAIQALPDAILLVSRDGTVVGANRRVGSLGIDSRALQDRPLWAATAEPPEAVRDYLDRCSRTAEPVAGALTLLKGDGVALACRCDGSAVRPSSDHEPETLLLRLVASDAALGQFAALNQRIGELEHEIARRVQLEAELREQKEWLAVTLASIGDGVLATDAAGRVAFLNPVAERLCGWSQSEAVEKPLDDVFRIVNETTRLPADNPVDRALREGTIVGLANHTVLIARNGHEVPIDDCAAPILNDRGRVVGVVLVFRDVTNERLAALRKERLAAIVESSDDIVASKDLNGILTSWNRGAERILGYTADEVIGKHVSMLMPPDHIEDTERILGRIRRGERVDHYETKRRRKDGTILDISLTVSPLRDRYGNIVGASKIGRDITRQKQLEAERLEADRRKDEFLAMLAHELRNPLASINSAVELFGKLDTATDLAWAKEVIQRQVRHLARLIDDLLDVSRITRGKIALRKEPVDFAHVIHGAADAVRPLVEQRRHELSVTLAGALPLAADPLRLEQVVVNLLTNAAKYTDPGGRIGLTARRQGDEIVLEVRDTGAGIASDLLPRVFDLFVQGDRTMARSEGGLGIGLTLVRTLVEMHGGSVTAASGGPGQGSQFVVRLPALSAEDAPEEPAARAARRGPGRQVRVLVVDDNADTARSLSKLLKLLGHDVRTAYDGPAALEIARSYRPEAVILDIGLPGMDGYEVVRRLRQEGCCTHALIIAVSGYGQDEDRRRSREAGFDQHLVKPVDFAALTDALAEPHDDARHA